MDRKCENHDPNKKRVVEEALENVDLIGKLAAVNLVEDLHEYECLKDDCVNNSFVRCNSCLALGI